MLLNPEFIAKILKFVIVGFSSFLIDMSITYLIKEKTKLGKYVANTCGLLISASYNFTLNRLWTFHSQDANIPVQIMWFSASMAFNLIMSNVLIYLFSDKLKFNFYIAKLIAIAIIMVWNFAVNNLLIFAH